MGRFDEDDLEDTSDREVSAALTVGEGDVDASLRPRSLNEFIGQPRVREQLQLVLEGAKNRGGTPDHILRMFEERRAIVGEFELATSFRFGGTPFDLAESGLKLYAKEVLPVLHAWKQSAVAQAAE